MIIFEVAGPASLVANDYFRMSVLVDIKIAFVLSNINTSGVSLMIMAFILWHIAL